MSLLISLCIGLGGAAGALLRALVGRLIRSDFPLPTLIVNILGSFILAAVYTGLPAASDLTRALLGTGFCGAFTTFSTFILEAVLLARSGLYWRAASYIVLTIGLCCLASWSAIYLMS